MTDAAKSRRNAKAAPEFIRFYASKWRTGCLGLTPEEIGVYIMICAYIAETGNRIPLERPHAHLGLHHAAFKKCVAALIAKGKVHLHEDGYGQDRAEKEYAAAASAVGKTATHEHPAATAGSTDRETETGCQGEAYQHTLTQADDGVQSDCTDTALTLQCQVNSEKTQQNQQPSRERDSDREKKEGAVERVREFPGFAELKTKLASAAGDGVDWNSPTIEITGPIAEMAKHRDLDLDILPAIAAECNRRRRKGESQVRGWEYFRFAIDRAWKARTRPQTAVDAIEVAKPAFQSFSDQRAARAAAERAEIIAMLRAPVGGVQ